MITARRWLSLALVLAVSTALHLFSLVRTPSVFVDEAWYASRAWGLLHTGRNFGPLDAGVFEHFDGYWTFAPWLGTWFQTQALRLLGLNLFAIRLPSLVFGLILLLAVFVVADHFLGRGAGLLAVALVSLSDAFFYSSHLARQDIMVAACGFGALALYVTDRSTRLPVCSVLSGLTIGLAFEIHPNAAIYGPALVALYLLDYRWSVLRTRRWWGFVLGLLVGLAFFVVMHLVRYPQTYYAITSLGFGAARTPPILTPNPQVWVNSIRRTLELTYIPLGFPPFVSDQEVRLQTLYFLCIRATAALAFVGPAILVFTHKAAPPARRLFVVCLAMLLGFVAINSYWSEYYAIYVSPSMTLMLIAFLTQLPQVRGRRRLAIPWVQLAWVPVVAALLLGFDRLRADTRVDYQATLNPMRQAISPEATILGSLIYWPDLADRHYYAWQQLTYYRRYVPGSTLEDGLSAFHPDYLILDGNTDWHTSDHPERYEPWAQLLYLPKTELTGFLASRASLVSETRTDSLGDVRVYKINWDEHDE